MADSRVIAKWLAEDQLEGRRRSVTVGPDQVAVVIRNGAYGEPQSETRVDTRGRFRGGSGQVEVLIASLSPFTVEYELDEIAGALGALGTGIPIVTRDGKAVSGNVRLTLAVNPNRPDLLHQLRHGRGSINDDDVADALRDEFLTQVIRTTVAEIESSELRGTSEQFRSFYQETQTQLESQLANYGLSLQNFAIHVLTSDVAAEAERQQIERRRQLEQASQEFGTPRRPDAQARSAPPPPPTQPPAATPSTGGEKSSGGKGKWIFASGILIVSAVIIVVAVGTPGPNGSDVVIVVAPTLTVAAPSNLSPSPTLQPETVTPAPTQVPATSPTVTRVPAPGPTPTATGPRDLPDMEVTFSHSLAESQTAGSNGGIKPGETLVIDIVTQPGARVEFSISVTSPSRYPIGESFADFIKQFGALVSSAPEKYTEQLIEWFREDFPGEEIPDGGWDHTICFADDRGECQFRWLLGTADFLMDPNPDDDNPSNVEIDITDNTQRTRPENTPYYLTVLGIPDLSLVELDPFDEVVVSTVPPAVPTPTPTPMPTSTPISIPTASPTPVPTSTPVPSVVQLAWMNADGVAITTVVEGTEVFLFAQLDGVPDSDVPVSVYEVDPFSADEIIISGSLGVIDGLGWATWTAFWMEDGLFGAGGDPEYKFVVLGVDSPELTVTKASAVAATSTPTAVPTTTTFDLGSTSVQVLAVQGTPDGVTVYSSETVWSYGYSRVTFNNSTDRVVEYSNTSNNLKLPAQAVDGSTFNIGSTSSEVRAAQGTPDGVTVYSSETVWSYGYSRVTFNNSTDRVVEYSNTSNNLKLP